jgi:hypothetical protein
MIVDDDSDSGREGTNIYIFKMLIYMSNDTISKQE